MRRTSLVSLFALLALIPCGPVSAQALLPPVFGNWSIGQTADAQPLAPQQGPGPDAAILQEYGFKSIEHQDYTRGKDTLSVTLYRMVDPTAAYGAFTFLRPAGMPDSKLTHVRCRLIKSRANRRRRFSTGRNWQPDSGAVR